LEIRKEIQIYYYTRCYVWLSRRRERSYPGATNDGTLERLDEEHCVR